MVFFSGVSGEPSDLSRWVIAVFADADADAVAVVGIEIGIVALAVAVALLLVGSPDRLPKSQDYT